MLPLYNLCLAGFFELWFLIVEAKAFWLSEALFHMLLWAADGNRHWLQGIQYTDKLSITSPAVISGSKPPTDMNSCGLHRYWQEWRNPDVSENSARLPYRYLRIVFLIDTQYPVINSSNLIMQTDIIIAIMQLLQNRAADFLSILKNILIISFKKQQFFRYACIDCSWPYPYRLFWFFYNWYQGFHLTSDAVTDVQFV